MTSIKQIIFTTSEMLSLMERCFIMNRGILESGMVYGRDNSHIEPAVLLLRFLEHPVHYVNLLLIDLYSVF
jgi:hypothetical protein